MAEDTGTNREIVVVNAAQHRSGWTIDNEDGTVELAFCTDRDWAVELARRWNTQPDLLKALQLLLSAVMLSDQVANIDMLYQVAIKETRAALEQAQKT